MSKSEYQPGVVITIERGSRTVFVNGDPYGKGIHYPDITFSDPARPSLLLGKGANSQTIELDGDGLRAIHIDGSAESPPVTVVYGRYDELPSAGSGESDGSSVNMLAAAAAKTWECIWCRGEVLVCGIDPRCSG